MKKQKHPATAFLWLLLIPVQLVIDTVIISAGAYADVSMADPDALGHPAPAVSILAFLVAIVFTIIVIIVAVILVIVRFAALKKRRRG